MRRNIFEFYRSSLHDFFEASFNVLVFLPYFFSIIVLLKSLFSPWKNLVIAKKNAAFSFDEWFYRHSFNTISGIIGFLMRLSIISFYIILQIGLIVLFPIIFLTYILLSPFLYIEYLFMKPENERKNLLKNRFINSHLLNEENRQIVEQWFEIYYLKKYLKKSWWKLSNLYSFPPVARDWAVGFTPVLDNYTIDLTNSDYQKKILSIIGRQSEIDEIERSLSKSEGANIIIVGDEGVGKHALVDTLAKKMYEGKTIPLLLYKRLLKLNMEKILSEFSDQTQRENFFEDLIGEASSAKNVILFIDVFDRYISVGENRVDLSFAIEKYARHNDINIIGVTTPFFYEKFVSPNEKINRYFTKIPVNEIPEPVAQEILLNSAFTFEQKYSVDIPYETIHGVIEKSSYYITSIPFPEKAIDLLDSACVYTRKNHQTQVFPQYIDIILSEKTHSPTVLTSNLKEKLVQMEPTLNSSVIDQKEAVSKLTNALQRSFMLIGLRKKPLATFLFLGPTGVGKTITAKKLADVFFGSDKFLLRLDMSLYQTREDIARLIGSMETGNPGLMTSMIRENPYGVLLLDEIEKADHDLINIFLTILDEGYFTDGYGKRVDCKNLVIIATSNAQDVEKTFSPEFLNRFDGVVTYQHLSNTTVVHIARNIVDKISADLQKLHKITLNVSDQYLQTLAEKAYDPKYGARDMERLIREDIEGKVAKMFLSNSLKEGQTLTLPLGTG